MNNQDEQLEVRKVAVEHHHAEAKRFVGWYEEMEKSRFANAFAYGRHKVDVLLDETLKELPAGAHILDVGCGTGEYVRRANDRVLVANGAEASRACREFVRPRLSLRRPGRVRPQCGDARNRSDADDLGHAGLGEP